MAAAPLAAGFLETAVTGVLLTEIAAEGFRASILTKPLVVGGVTHVPLQLTKDLGRVRDVEDFLLRLERHSAVGLTGQRRGGQARRAASTGWPRRHRSGTGTRLVDLAGDMRDRVHAVELDGRGIDLGDREAGRPEDRDPDQVAMIGINDPVFVGIDQDRRGKLRVAHRHGGLGESECVLGEERVADSTVVERAGEGSDPDDAGGCQRLAGLAQIELREMVDAKFEVRVGRGILQDNNCRYCSARECRMWECRCGLLVLGMAMATW